MKPHSTNVTKCFKEAVTDYHFLANLLCLKYKGKHLCEAGQEAARQLLLQLHPEHPEVIADACAFTAGPDPFPASFLWTPAQRSLSEVHVMFCECYFIYFLWPPYAPAQVNRDSQNFYTWWTLSVNREVTTWIFSWSLLGWAKK